MHNTAFKGLQWGLNFSYIILRFNNLFHVVAHGKNVPHYCLQPYYNNNFFIVVQKRGNCSNFSACVFFCVCIHNAIIFPRCGSQRAKMIDVARTAENFQPGQQQRRKMFEFDYVHKFETACLGPRLMCFMEKSWREKTCGTVPLRNI